jgi:ankyrin repeat protein
MCPDYRFYILRCANDEKQGGESILFKAAKYGHALVVQELLDNDANVDQPDEVFITKIGVFVCNFLI